MQGKLNLIIETLRNHKLRVALVLILSFSISILNAIIPYFSKLQIDQLQKQTVPAIDLGSLSSHQIFLIVLVIPLVIELLRLSFFDRVSIASFQKLETLMRLQIQDKVWDRMSTLDFGFFENRSNRRIINAAANSARVVMDFVYFSQKILGNVTSLIAIIPLLSLVDWRLALIVFVSTLIQAVISGVAQRQEVIFRTVQDRIQDRFWRVDSVLNYDFHNVLVLGAASVLKDEYGKLANEKDDVNLKGLFKDSRFRNYQWMVSSTAMLAVNLIVGYGVLRGDLTIGTFTLVTSYTLQLSGAFKGLVEALRNWQELDLRLDQLQFFLSLKPRIKTDENEIKKIIVRPKNISFSNVHFTYPDFRTEERGYLKMILKKSKMLLKNSARFGFKYELEDWVKLINEKTKNKRVIKGINIEIERGKLVAMVGRNGSGKTTITNLMMHNYEPSEGEILLDGIHLPGYDRNEVLRQFAVIQQNPFVFWRFTLRDNITMGINPKPTDGEIWDILGKIDLKTAVEESSKGLDSIIGEEIVLSGGQQQLLVVARTLLMKRPFIIFDEGMNQLDIEHETSVINLLKQQAENAGVLFITHRITTARKADYIYVMDDGKIAQEGRHDQLIQEDGLYKRAWNMQVIE